MYAEVNRLFGDIVKVTPTSKVVGDMALFMVGQQPDAGRRARRRRASWRFPNRWWSSSRAGWASRRAAFPRSCRSACCAAASRSGPARRQPAAGRFRRHARRAGKAAQPAGQRPRSGDATCCIRASSPTSPTHQAKYSDTSVLPTPVFFYGMEPGEEISVDIEPGKTLIVKFLTVGDPHADGRRMVFFELNGQPREVLVLDQSLAGEVTRAAEGRAGQSAAGRGADAGLGGAACRWRPANRWRPGRSCSRWKR